MFACQFYVREPFVLGGWGEFGFVCLFVLEGGGRGGLFASNLVMLDGNAFDHEISCDVQKKC